MLDRIFGVHTSHLLLFSRLIEWWIDLWVVHCHSSILLVYLIHNFAWVSSLVTIFNSLRLILLILSLILFLEFTLKCKDRYKTQTKSAFHNWAIHVKQGQEEPLNKTLFRTIDEAQDAPRYLEHVEETVEYYQTKVETFKLPFSWESSLLILYSKYYSIY